MAQFSTQFLDRLRERINLSEIISQKVALKKKGSLLLGLCPFHNEKTPSFNVNNTKGFYHCFGCEAHGDAISFLIQSEGLAFPDAVERLADIAGMELPKEDARSAPRPEEDKSFRLLEEVCIWFEQNLQSSTGSNARDYLASRQISDESVRRFRLGYAPAGFENLRGAFKNKGYSDDDLIKIGVCSKSQKKVGSYDRFRDRLMFAITDARGRVVGFGGRSMDGTDPKYMNSPETPFFHKGALLYGFQHSAQGDRRLPLIVTEGYMDVIALSQTGRYRSVAPLGTAVTEEQILRLKKLHAEPILCFDGDAAGQKAMGRAAVRALTVVSSEFLLRFAGLPQGEDPDSLVRQGQLDVLDGAFKKAMPLADAIWRVEANATNFSIPENCAALKKRLDLHVKTISDVSVQQFYETYFFKKIREATVWKPNFQKRTSSGAAKKPEAVLDLPKVDKKSTLSKILLATVMQHPHLLDKVEEDFASLDVEGNLKELQRVLLAQFHSAPDGERSLYQEALQKEGVADIAKRLVDQVYLHAPFVRHGVDEGEAMNGWNYIWAQYCEVSEGVLHIHEMKNAFEESFDEETWERLKKMQRAKLERNEMK